MPVLTARRATKAHARADRARADQTSVDQTSVDQTSVDHDRRSAGWVEHARRALLLNASREPLCVLGGHRAVSLVLDGKAVVLETDGRVLRSPSVSIPLPQVLCLVRYVHVPYRSVIPLSRRAVLARDGHRCAYCAGPADTVDHVHPRSRGGGHEWTNVVAACSRCNHRKADRLLAELGWQLLVSPTVPRGPTALLGATARPHPSWRAYLAA